MITLEKVLNELKAESLNEIVGGCGYHRTTRTSHKRRTSRKTSHKRHTSHRRKWNK